MEPGVIGRNLREIRRKRGMTQAMLARASGRSHSIIRDLECGIQSMVLADTLAMLAKALGVTCERLLRKSSYGPR